MVFVEVRVAMVFLSPVVSLAIFSIGSSSTFSLWVSPSYFSTALFVYYPTGFSVYLGPRKYWWDLSKYVLEVSHVF